MRQIFLLLFRTVLLFSLFLGHAALAQQPAPNAAPIDQSAADTPANQALKGLEQGRRQLQSLQETAKQNADNDDALVDLAGKTDELVRSVQDATGSLNPRLDQIKARLKEIGEPPKEGQPPEAEVVTKERNALTAERAQLNAVISDGDTVLAAANKLAAEIVETRRQLFTATLFRRTEISVSVLDDAARAFEMELARFADAVASWAGFVWKFKRIPLFAALFMSFAAGAVLLLGGYRLFGRYFQRREGEERAPYLSRLSVAFWSTLIRSLSLAVLLITSYFFLDSFNVLRPDIAPIVAALYGSIGLVYFVGRFTNAVFAPKEPHWRLVKLSNRGAFSISLCLVAMAVVNALDYFFSSISEAMGSPLVLTVLRSFAAALVIGLILIAASFGRPMLARNGDPDAPGRHWPKGLRIILRFLGLALIVTAFGGYVVFARFVATQLIITGAVIVTMYIGILSGRALSQAETFSHTFLGQFLERRFRLGPVAIDQAGLGVGLLISAVALCTGVPLILLLWGFHVQDLELLAYRLFTEVKLGGISISLIGILTGALLFAVLSLLTRWLQRWLDNNVMARSHVDIGVRNSVKTGIGYLGVGIAAIIAISAAGIDLSSFALVASALSVGIGFGLQNIVSNFVSGLILLVERPFKVGDHVVSGTAEGIVKRISVRATEIETFRKQSIIVPNSDLINGLVGNWTHRNKMARSEIPVSVSYNDDPQRVIDILLELAGAHPLILRNPEPHVEFLRFGAYSLDFELRFMLADMSEGLKVRNGIRIEILKRFKQEGISMPFPQSDVTIQPKAAAPAQEMIIDAPPTPPDAQASPA